MELKLRWTALKGLDLSFLAVVGCLGALLLSTPHSPEMVWIAAVVPGLWMLRLVTELVVTLRASGVDYERKLKKRGNSAAVSLMMSVFSIGAIVALRLIGELESDSPLATIPGTLMLSACGAPLIVIHAKAEAWVLGVK